MAPATVPARREADLAGLARAIAQIGDYVDGLRERVRMLEAVIENFPGGISLFDQDLQMVLCNRRQIDLLEYPEALFANGYPTLEALFRFNAERGEYGPGDVEMHVHRRAELAQKREAHCYDRTRPNGMTMEVRGMPLEGGGFVTTYVDVTEQRKAQALIAHMAQHDPLTDLPNRMLFHDRLKTAIAQVKRGGMMAVHYLDLDNFKPVNDNHGHQAGDELLVGVAGRLRQAVREHDTIARLGGDEFAIVQTQIHEPRDAEVLANRVLEKFATPFALTGAEVKVGVSIGIAVAPDDGISSDDLLIKADNALYRSKSSGRGCFHFFRRAA
jgi:diguanylate cyclase (GGDEF)-like protein